MVTIYYPSGEIANASVPFSWGSKIVFFGAPVFTSHTINIESGPWSAVIKISSGAKYVVQVILLHFH